MRRTILQLLIGAAFAAAPMLVPSTANAALESCGNIDLRGDARCEVVVEGGCLAQCEPVSFEASCAAELQVGCEGQCNASIDATCTASCSGGCEAECEVDPGSFECAGSCKADCSANCDGRCAAEANKGECSASCRATCGADCDARCNVNLPEADCKAQCQACCGGSCEAQANFDCQISCQAKGFAECKAELKGGCEVQCKKPEGALFCDGQFVDTSSLESCIAELQAELNVEVTGYAECRGNTCEAAASVSCAAEPTRKAPLSGSALAAMAAGLGLMIARRRKHG
jgi:hypothetical protein